MIGCSTCNAMVRTMSLVNCCGVVEVPIRMVGFTAETVVARSMMPDLAAAAVRSADMAGQRFPPPRSAPRRAGEAGDFLLRPRIGPLVVEQAVGHIGRQQAGQIHEPDAPRGVLL